MIYKTITIATIFLLGQIIPSYAQTPEHIAPGVSPFEHTYNDIKFLDAYFGTSSGKIEVQPSDKNVPFTIVFSNIGAEDIAGIKGLLSLPIGFSPTIANANGALIEADITQVATSGSPFYLTFFVNVDKSTSINSYSGTVQVTYSRVRENGSHTNYFDFNFKVPGKSVLNMKAENTFIRPESNNQIVIQIFNNGTAPLNNVDIELNSQSNSTIGSSNLQNVVIDKRHWNIGTVDAQSTQTFSFNIFVPPDLAGQTLHIPFTVTYFDAQGNQITNTGLGDLIVGPASSNFVIKLSTPSYLMMGVMQNLTLGLENLSPSKISDISITLVPSSSNLKILQDPRWFVNDIKPLERTALNIPVFADQSISNQAVNFDVNIQYTKDSSTVIEKQSFATYIRPVIDISVYGVDVMNIGGKQNVIGNILNQGNIKGQFATVTIEPVDNSKIKKSVQYIGDIDIDAPTPFNIPIDFKDNPSFGENKVVVTVTYKDSLLQPHTITEEDTIILTNPTPPSSDNSQIQLVILVAVAAGIGGIVFKIRKAKVPITKKITENSS